MYPPPKREHNPACTPREFVDLLDHLIQKRITELANPREVPRVDSRQLFEEAEVVKRQLTDYLLVNSKEVGIVVQGEHR